MFPPVPQAFGHVREGKAAIAFAIVLLLTGCSVVMAARQPGKREINIFPGMPRAEVIQALGTPVSTTLNEEGRLTDTFSFRQGYSTGARAGRTIGHGIADVLTLGLWEIVGTPIEIWASGTPTTIIVTYDKHERVVSSEVMQSRAGAGAEAHESPAEIASPTWLREKEE